MNVLAQDPFRNPPPFEKPVGDPEGACSRRIKIQHRWLGIRGVREAPDGSRAADLDSLRAT